MTSAQDIQKILIANTIRLISEGGFEKATTKAITHSGETPVDFRMNEVYIYRYFGSKEHLYEVVFETLDVEFFSELRNAIDQIDGIEANLKDNLYSIFLSAWSFVLGNETRCRCYVRYYYSIYFKGASLEKHNERFEGIVSDFSLLFGAGTDADMIMHSILMTILDFAVRVFNGDLEDNDANVSQMFNMIYHSMLPYFKEELKTQANTQ